MGGLPILWSRVVKNPSADAGDAGSIPGLRRSPEEGNDNPFQYPCLGNPGQRSLAGYIQSTYGSQKSQI